MGRTVTPTGGVPQIGVSTSTGTRLFGNRSAWKHPASASAGDLSLAGAGAGSPASGKPLAYAEVFANGKARLLVAWNCET